MLGVHGLASWIKLLVAIAVSIVFSALFVLSIDVGDVAAALGDADYVYVAPALALFALSMIARSVRWRVFLQPEDDVPWMGLLPSLLVGYAGNNLLPLRAGELLRAQHLAGRRGVARMRTLGTLVMERLFDAAVLSTFVLWGLVLAGSGTAYLGIGLALAALSVAGFIGCFAVAVKPGLPAKLSALPLPLVTPGIRREIANLSGSFLSGFGVLTSASRFAAAAAATAAAWGLELSMYWLISRGFGLDASFLTVAFAGAAANVAMSLPSAQGGVGPFQFSATKALLAFGVLESAAAAYALALHIFLVVPVSLAGLIVLWRTTSLGARQAVAAPALGSPSDG